MNQSRKSPSLPSLYKTFLNLAFALAVLCFGCAASTNTWAQRIPVEGTDYRVVQPAQPTDSPNKIEVVEFFWYGCPHCNALEPAFAEWIKRQGPDVVVRRVPIAFNNGWMPHQRLYYTLEVLGREPELRAKVFATIHLEHNMLNTPELMADWASKNGIDKKKFTDIYNSFTVQSKIQHASQMMVAFGVDGVPTIGVNGKYALNVTPTTLSNIDYLVSKERALLKPVTAAEPAAVAATTVAAAAATPAPDQASKHASTHATKHVKKPQMQ